jgi:hypothetical protein
MVYRSAKNRRDLERQVTLLARIIEVRGGDDEGYASQFLEAMVRQAKPEDRAITVNLASQVDAWRRARRAYRHFFR